MSKKYAKGFIYRNAADEIYLMRVIIDANIITLAITDPNEPTVKQITGLLAAAARIEEIKDPDHAHSAH